MTTDSACGRNERSKPEETPAEAEGRKPARKDGGGAEGPEEALKRKQAVDPALMPGGDPAGAA